MLWLKAWLETRWRVVWAAFVGFLFFSMPLMSGGSHLPPTAARVRLGMHMLLVAQAAFLATIMLAGSGIHTASTRPGASDKGADRSMLFTLSLPVTRLRLFLVRTGAGLLETGALLAILFTALWMVWPQTMAHSRDAFAYFAVVTSCSLALYAVSACLSTFCDEGARIRGSVLILIVPSFVILRLRAGRSPIGNFSALTLMTHHIPWLVIGTAGILALVCFAAAITIIQRRDY